MIATALAGRRGLALAAMIALWIGLAFVGEPGREVLHWSRSGIAAGEHWRWLTAHLVHLDLAHAVLNAAGLALVWVLFFDLYSVRRWLLVAACGIVTIDVGLWWLSDIRWYVGASGVLNTLAAAGIVREIIDGDRMAWFVGAAGLTKLVYENLAGPLPFLASDHPIVLEAHLFGALAGMVCGLLMQRTDVPSAPRTSEAAGA
jgi:rhomboid family GlyGly-CTERM serine protease